MGGYTKDQLLARLKKLQVEFSSYDHPKVLTVEAQAKYVGHLGGGLTKNLFLKDKKHRYYVVSALAGTTVDLKVLSQRLGLGKGGLRMAPEEALQKILKVPLGCVTPFAIVNESAQCVSLLLDQGFKSQKFCLFHPLSNDMTIALCACDLDKFLISIGKSPSYVDLEATPLVGKDQLPDLVALVPSGVPALVDQSAKSVQDGVPSEAHLLVKKKTSSEGEAISKPVNVRKAPEKVENISKSLAGFVDVGQLIDELIYKTTAAVLTEVSKQSEQQSGPLKPIQEGVKKRIGPDLENLTMSLKNAAYTEGFHSGVQSVLQRGFQGSSSGR